MSKPGGAASGNGPEAAPAGEASGTGQQPAGDGTESAAQAPLETAGTAGTSGIAGAMERERELANQLAERTADLQRVTAEYANYRKRVDRDRLAVREQALANVLSALLPVLDDIGRAREHGELVGGFKSVADSLESAVTKLGLSRFGTEGEPFDPTVHEALTHSYSADVAEPTCVQILQPGYMVGERILRPARVAVAEPDDSAATSNSGDEARPAGGAGSQENREDDD